MPDNTTWGATAIHYLGWRNKTLNDILVVCPTHPVYGVFKALIVLACMLSSFVYGYFAAFRYDVDGYWCPEGTYTAIQAATKGFSTTGLTECATFEARQAQVDAIQLTEKEIRSCDLLQLCI